MNGREPHREPLVRHGNDAVVPAVDHYALANKTVKLGEEVILVQLVFHGVTRVADADVQTSVSAESRPSVLWSR